MHGRIECPECGDVKAGCRCFQHGHIVLWETCDKCKVRLSSQPEEPQFKTESHGPYDVGGKLLHEFEVTPKMKHHHHFKVVNRQPGNIASGANTQIYMDGKPLKGCSFFKFEVEAAGLAKVTIEMIGEFSMQNEIGELETKIIPLVPKGKDNDPTQ